MDWELALHTGVTALTIVYVAGTGARAQRVEVW
jgi:hypothetical protein